MSVRVSLSDLVSLLPGRAWQPYIAALPHINAVLACFGILNSARRTEHFLAQILHESGGLTLYEENLNYSAAGIVRTWPKRFPTLESARPFARNPQALANRTYGGRLGNVEPNDGWHFRGRGLPQVTGRASYARISKALDVDFVAQPELVTTDLYAFPVAAQVWRQAGCNALADTDSLRDVTKAINGGHIGLESRAQWLERVRAAGVVR